MANSELLTREQAAEMLGLRVATLAVWACTGRHNLPYIKVGSRVRYRREELDAWLASRTVKPSEQESVS